MSATAVATRPSLEPRVEELPWDRIARDLDASGFACTGPLLTPGECRELSSLWNEEAQFRSRVVMARHGFGRGEYRYFGEPLPDVVARLREASYPHLVPVANAWAERLGEDRRFPATLSELRRDCRVAGQTRPTPLLLRYGADDYNCLHQDVYGDLVFPLQLAVLLSEPGEDFEGGEFVLTEQRPRRQSRVEVVPLRRGDAVLFAVHHRPVEGARGSYRVNMRHGVGRIRSGERFTLGVIFHDAA